jgi:hypothetical protein
MAKGAAPEAGAAAAAPATASVGSKTGSSALGTLSVVNLLTGDLRDGDRALGDRDRVRYALRVRGLRDERRGGCDDDGGDLERPRRSIGLLAGLLRLRRSSGHPLRPPRSRFRSRDRERRARSLERDLERDLELHDLLFGLLSSLSVGFFRESLTSDFLSSTFPAEISVVPAAFSLSLDERCGTAGVVPLTSCWFCSVLMAVGGSGLDCRYDLLSKVSKSKSTNPFVSC